MRQRILKALKKITAATVAFSVAVVSIFAGTITVFGAVPAPSELSALPAQEPPRVIAHGGGMYQGYETTNSQDAVRNAMAKGYKYIELDMDFSKDGKIIMIHDWDRTYAHYFGAPCGGKLTLEEFSNIMVNGKFKTLSMDQLVKMLTEAGESAKDVKIVTDTKGDNIALLTAIAQQYPEMIRRIIPQIYDYDEWTKVKALGYDNIIFTLYALGSVNYEELVTFAKTKDLWAVAVGEGYVVKDLEKRLPKEGIRVYYHPVATYEDAKILMDNDVYGVYSGTLLPDDFTGGQEIYLKQQKGDRQVKLTDVQLLNSTMQDILAVPLAGLSPGDFGEYLLDGAAMEEVDFQSLKMGRHTLKINIFSKLQKPIKTLEYSLWKNEIGFRLLDQRYDYRLDELKPLPVFGDVMEKAAPQGSRNERSKKIIDILESSFISKAGEYYYYNNGEIGKFKLGQELLHVQSYRNGDILLPLADTAKAMGADSVVMDQGKYIYVKYAGDTFVSMAGSHFSNTGASIAGFRSPLTIYRGKTMAPGEFLEFVTGRSCVENREVIVILPAKAKVSEKEKAELLDMAGMLYM